MRTTTTPVLAGLALVAGIGCVVGLLVAATRPGAIGLDDYLSRLGEPGAVSGSTYRWSLWLGAAGLLLLALALLGRPVLRLAAAALAVAGVLLAVSALVPCAQGCPIPLRQGLTTPANWVHFVASGGVFAVLAFAMWTVSQDAGWPRLQLLSRCCAWGTAGLIAVLGLLMVTIAHGPVNGLVERVLAALGLGWVLVVAAVFAVPRPATAP